jgi:hypothetical protein
MFLNLVLPEAMAVSSRGPQTLSMPESSLETELGWDRPPSPPPLLMFDRTYSDGEGEEVEKDDVHGRLVIGRQLLIPRQTSLRDISSSELQRGVTGRGHLPHQRENHTAIPSKQREQRVHVQHVERKRNVAHHPRPSQVRNELSVRGAEVALRVGLTSRQRDDTNHTDHPNNSSRVDLRRFDVRIGTFARKEWHHSLPRPEKLARAGLYYTGMEDTVRCFSCGVQLEEWGEEEALGRHCHASPNCAFLRQDFPNLLESLTPSPSSQQAQYSNTSLRLHSYSNWPLSSVVTSYQLASVGFFYTGEGTKVVCFSCGLEVRDWRRGDVPLLVHCRANPECTFIKSIIEGSSSSERAPAPILKTMATDSANRPNYSDLNIRFQSFKKLSPAFPIPRMMLAEAGLFLLRLPDVMKCHSCEVVLQSWVDGDVAVEKHRGASPNCPFLAEKFPSKLSSVDPSTLPAAEFDERELEMMALQPPTLTSHSPTGTLSLAGLSLSDPHTLTSSKPHSLTPNSPLSTAPPPSHHASSGYHSMSQPPSLSKTMSSCDPSSPLGAVGGRNVSFPPSYSLGTSTASADTNKQPSSLPAGGECVVCMDRPLEMVFVPCGHICVCEECSSQISRCPICRTRTQMAVKVYFPY